MARPIRMYRHAAEPGLAEPRADAGVHHCRGADPRHRHRRQRRDFQRHRRRAAQAAALPPLRRAGHGRSRRAGREHRARRRRAVSLLHLSRGRPRVPGCRHVEHRNDEPDGARAARGSADAVRHRRHPADAGRPADARPADLEDRRRAGRSRDGHAVGRLLALEIRGRPIRGRPHADARQPPAPDHRRAPRLVSLSRPEDLSRHPVPHRSQQGVPGTVQLQRHGAVEAGDIIGSSERRRGSHDSHRVAPVPAVRRRQRADVRRGPHHAGDPVGEGRAGRRRREDAVGADGDHRDGPADRVRQRGQPAPRARRRPAAGAGDSGGAWRGHRTARA